MFDSNTKAMPRAIDMVWFKQRFDELERQHALILKRLDDAGRISPELEEQVWRCSAIAGLIDQKVPDRPRVKQKEKG